MAKKTTSTRVKKTDATPKKTAKKRITFLMQAEPGRSVTLAGTFNNWNPEANPLKEKGGKGAYSIIMLLAPGVYEYKFVVDGMWCVDPGCQEWVQNELGTLNSVLRV